MAKCDEFRHCGDPFRNQPEPITSLAEALGLQPTASATEVRDAVSRLVDPILNSELAVEECVVNAARVVKQAVSPPRNRIDFHDIEPVFHEGRFQGARDLKQLLDFIKDACKPKLGGALPSAPALSSAGPLPAGDVPTLPGNTGDATTAKVLFNPNASRLECGVAEMQQAVQFLRANGLIAPDAKESVRPPEIQRLLTRCSMQLVWNNSTGSWDPALVSRDGARRSLFRQSEHYFQRLDEGRRGRPGSPAQLTRQMMDLKLAKQQLIQEARRARGIEDGEPVGVEGELLRAQAMAAGAIFNRTVAHFEAKRMLAFYGFIRDASRALGREL